MSDPSTQRLVKYQLTMEMAPDAEQNAKRFSALMGMIQNEALNHVKNSAKAREERETSAVDKINQEHRKQLGVMEDIHTKATRMVEIAEEERTRIIKHETEKQTEARKTALEKLEEQHRKHVDGIHRSTREMHDSFLSAGEGLVTFGRGLAEIGVAGEEDIEKMLRVLIRVQAVVDVTKGGIEIYRGIRSAVDAYRNSVLAAAAAEEALNLARARGGTRAAANLGLTGLGTTATTVASGTIGTTGLGSTLTTAIAGLGTTLSGAILSIPGALALAIAGVGAGGAMAFNVGGIRDRSANAIDPTMVDPNSMMGSIGGSMDRIGQFDTLFFGGLPINRLSMFNGLEALQDSAKARQTITQQMEAKRQSYLSGEEFEQFQRDNNARQNQFDLRRQLRQLAIQREQEIDALTGGPNLETVRDRFGIAQRDLKTARQQFSMAESLEPGRMQREELVRAQNQLVEAHQRVKDLTERRIQLEREAGQESIAAARARSSELQKQLDLAKQQRMEAESRYLSAKERFGQMDEVSQHNAIMAMQRAQRLGIGRAGELSRDERMMLRNIGTQQAEQFARAGDTAAAEIGNFDQFFGTMERQVLNQLGDGSPGNRKIISELQAKLDIESRIIVETKLDVEKITKTVVDAATSDIDHKFELMNQQIRQDIEQQGSNRSSMFGGGPGQTRVGG
ncbi:hypothetical protein Pan97_34860 [Bremerella volcania]|uniref:Uncharacterized protein n=1 Tax=Bremerella volcania TaxID=2527984 RepID=A0A518CB39_9BACT|nr:hypothetical protein [Bremerella volcania]QDU76437.1 hypothetical protein Pan97_34860 [Bremerella volcania]